MTARRLPVLVLVAVLVAAAAAAAVLLNLLLLGSASASNDPVGQLQSHGHLAPAPAWIIRPTGGQPHDEGADD